MEGLNLQDELRQVVRGLDWLVRLRWLAAATILFFAALAAWVYSIQMPWGLVGAVTGLVIMSNLAVRVAHPSTGGEIRKWLAGLIFGDVLLLTMLLYFTGGAHNPFTVLYVLHITLAVMLLGAGPAWLMVGLCGAGFGLLFYSGHMLIGPGGGAVCNDLDFHLQGMLAATVVTGAGVVYFVTHLHRSLEELRRSARLASGIAEKERNLAAVLSMAAGVAHELATPLGTIAIASRELELSSQENCCNQECRNDIHLIRNQVQLCSNILQRMGNLARRTNQADGEKISPSDIPLLVTEFLSPQIAAAVEWDAEPPPPGVVVPGDDIPLILGNVLRNAWEATGQGQGTVRVTLRSSADSVLVSICDGGPGMDEATLARLGEPFFSTKSNAGGGMGLGFFLSKSLVEMRGGSINVQSAPGKGTCVTVRLPLERNPGASAAL